MNIKIKEVNSDNLFYDGYKYLTRSFPDNALAIASYDGYSTFNLATSIIFDREQKVIPVESYLTKPKRYIAYEGTAIVGVMVVISLPEFGAELDFETYVIIDAKTHASYNALLSLLIGKSEKLEIVTYRTEYLNYIYKNFFISLNAIHNWKLFHIGEIKNAITMNSNIRLANTSDLIWSRRLTVSLPIERSPFRSLCFQFAGLPYLNFVYHANGIPNILVGIRKYCSLAWEIHYVVTDADSEILNSDIADLIRYAISIAIQYKPNVLWRIRNEEYARYEHILNQLCFNCVVKEDHLHLREIHKKEREE
jgi:hypothetical protein